MGFNERVVGTSVWFNPVLPEFEELNAGIACLADNDSSFESIMNRRPELVTVMFEWHIGPEGHVATREQFHELGIPTCVMPTDCEDKDNSVGIDGTHSALFDTANLYRGIEKLAMIYDLQARGQEVVPDLRARCSATGFASCNSVASSRSAPRKRSLTRRFWQPASRSRPVF
ncbi:ABC transporter substrate-binding protein [Gymnodinialimonas sp. 2305UL16-5]|uniref:ABC transporter substrate-binding protein n=1 Tax=Gymnodinialimonas mytili TaxID=3126503 RepID=UPI0030961EAA